MYLVIMIIIDFKEDINRSLLEMRMDMKFPELELLLNFLELELRLLVSCGIGIEKNGIGLELKTWNWPCLHPNNLTSYIIIWSVIHKVATTGPEKLSQL